MSAQGAVVRALRTLGLVAALMVSACASVPLAEGLPSSRVAAILDDPTLGGTRWGLLAMTTDGRTVLNINADERFIPASNTKIFTTVAAFALLGGSDAPDPDSGTVVRTEVRAGGEVPDLVLIGAGDPALRDSADCVSTCLGALADTTAVQVRRVRDVIGDDRLYPDERWGPGWSWEDLQTSYGTAVSALTVNENVVVLEATPGAQVGEPVHAVWRTGDNLLRLDNTAVTVAEGETDLRLERHPGYDVVRLHGRMLVTQPMQALRLGIDDPAAAAAERFRRLLEARGVVVEGEVRARHRLIASPINDHPGERTAPELVPEGEEIARLPQSPLLDSLNRISKASQNLHAELLLHRLGALDGDGSRADGLVRVEALAAEAGVQRAAYDLSDGSGLSVYNRVSPRATATLLRWALDQSWGPAFWATLPVGGRDGSLARRFVGTPLEGRISAKTGTLNGTNALAGFLTAASGRTLVFAIYANDRPSSAGSALVVMDHALLALAAEN